MQRANGDNPNKTKDGLKEQATMPVAPPVQAPTDETNRNEAKFRYANKQVPRRFARDTLRQLRLNQIWLFL
jgi:hypothetical protein